MDQPDPFDVDELAEREDIRRVRTQLQIDTEDADFRWLMSGERGRRIVWRLLTRSGVWRTSYSTNFGEMSKREGEKMIGYWALDQISRLCPETYMQMVQEQKNGRAVADNRSIQH